VTFPPAFGGADDVRLDAPVLDGPHLAGSPHARLHLVHDQQDTVLVTDVPQAWKKALRRDDVPPLPLDGLHDNGGDLLWRQGLGEHRVFEVVDDGVAAVPIAWARQDGPVGIGVRDVRDAAHAWEEAGPLHRFAGGERQRAHGAPMERAVEADETRPAGVVARQLDCGFDRFSARVGHEAHGRFLERGDRVQLLGQLHPERVVKVHEPLHPRQGLWMEFLATTITGYRRQEAPRRLRFTQPLVPRGTCQP